MTDSIKIIALSAIVLLSKSCKTPREAYYSYRTVTYVVDSVKTPLYYDNLISYGSYVFEFKTTSHVKTEVFEDSSGQSTSYDDTTGVYLLATRDQLYYEFDTFALKGKVIKVGRLTDKPLGLRIKFEHTQTAPKVSFGPLKKVELNRITCYVTDVISPEEDESEASSAKFLLMKMSHFNSLYKINNVKYPDSAYCVVGFQMYDQNAKTGINQEIDEMRGLSDRERAICSSMIQKIGSVTTDTLRASLRPQ